MSSSFDDGVKERIREAIDIVELVSQYVPLKRAGRNYVGRCPWHDDSRPSLQINPVRQSYKCWVCDVGGDVFSFVMKVENVDFKEALQILADKAGIALPKKEKKILLKPTGTKPVGDPNDELSGLGEEDENASPAVPAREISKQALYQALDWLAKSYHEALYRLDEASGARKYLEDRGIIDSDIKKFQIGYAPMEFDWLPKRVKHIPERLQILEIVGNLLERDQESEVRSREPQYFDRFRGRVIFPIRDTQNRTVAFGGRVLPGSTSPAKYVNSPETPLFSKHRMLFGLDLARHKMKETRRALIMEGYTDVIVAHQFGFGDAVAVLGTALGPEHIRILKRYVDKMILVLDGDEAGRKRADQVLELFVAQGVDMAVLTLPAGQDPCDFLQEHGAEAFEMLLKTDTTDVLEHAFQSATRNIDLKDDIIGASKALDSLLGIIAQAPTKGITPDDPIRIRIEKTILNLSHRFLVTEDQIRRRLKEKRNRIEDKKEYVSSDETERNATNGGDESGIWSSSETLPDPLEREMLELWLADPTTVYEFWGPVPVTRCRSPITRMIYEKCNELIERNKPATFDRLIVAFDDPKMKSFLVKLDESGREKRSVKPEPPIGYDEPERIVFQDELSALEESLRSETEEEPELLPELRQKLIREILDGFDRRDQVRTRIEEVNQLRGDSLTEEEKADKLLRLQEQLRKRQEEKRRRMDH